MNVLENVLMVRLRRLGNPDRAVVALPTPRVIYLNQTPHSLRFHTPFTIVASKNHGRNEIGSRVVGVLWWTGCVDLAIAPWTP